MSSKNHKSKPTQILVDHAGRLEWRSFVHNGDEDDYDHLHHETLPAVQYTTGDREWYLNGKLHRENGPAVIASNGAKLWYINGREHRDDGPAVIFASGLEEWWFNGRQVSRIEFEGAHRI